MEILRFKARLSVLWLTMAIGTVASMFLGILTPGTMGEIMTGEWGGTELSQGMMVLMAFFFIIPMVVAILSLTLNGSANRWMNFVLGIIWFLWLIVEIIEHATMEGTMYIASYLMLITGLIIAAYIVYFAWRLPKAEA